MLELELTVSEWVFWAATIILIVFSLLKLIALAISEPEVSPKERQPTPSDRPGGFWIYIAPVELRRPPRRRGWFSRHNITEEEM